MSYSKFPNDVAKLFKPGPPLQFQNNTSYYKSNKVFHDLKLSPLADVLKMTKTQGERMSDSSILDDYLQEFPQGSDNNHLKKIDELKTKTINHFNKLESYLSEWNPDEDPNIKGTDPYKTIFVGRLPYDITEIELQKIFSKFGKIDKIRIVKDNHHRDENTAKIPMNKSKGYAFIVFNDASSSKMATREIGVHRGLLINNRICIVDIERSRTFKYFKPRRLGGGLGGRGYSQNNNSDTNVSSGATSSASSSGKSTNSYPISNTHMTSKRYRSSSSSNTLANGPPMRSRYSNQPMNMRPKMNPGFNNAIPNRYNHQSSISSSSSITRYQHHHTNNNNENVASSDGSSMKPQSSTSTSYRSRTARTQKKEMPDY
ncbi:hypothetical protein TBLA_0C04680 [Henningerozyma blattae CBS 6284]|uniref:RRM domain-containing protein n=1 Tax=Henningerozyma blattae (strain ATCC 34711 / CBS 6284 / DSM 70876 / NBRC 10599 / NRRL Y-10934 / UCD 77-7) TaxID=1071380 RepID=I2H1L2_HENB6|nr:hypothetical protein TBLA_0C04680 [Tetrapisispora blattae CBS 6284]CCH60264.1 hypothetical protein TBLA_0C04680 [Tetrapisispora blattae CBS 6284]